MSSPTRTLGRKRTWSKLGAVLSWRNQREGATMSAVTISPAVGYLRVSTREQGRSGLGLAAQRHEIEAFGSREGFAVRS